MAPNPKLKAFYDFITDCVAKWGYNVKKITDAVLVTVFPSTFEAAEHEGCSTALRIGVTKMVTKALKKPPPDRRQGLMKFVDPELVPFVEEMGSVVFKVADNESGSDMVDVLQMLEDDEVFDRVIIYQEGVTRANAQVLNAMRRTQFANRAMKDRRAKESGRRPESGRSIEGGVPLN